MEPMSYETLQAIQTKAEQDHKERDELQRKLKDWHGYALILGWILFVTCCGLLLSELGIIDLSPTYSGEEF